MKWVTSQNSWMPALYAITTLFVGTYAGTILLVALLKSELFP